MGFVQRLPTALTPDVTIILLIDSAELQELRVVMLKMGYVRRRCFRDRTVRVMPFAFGTLELRLFVP